jgi:glucose/arabinose dehydrogenase
MFKARWLTTAAAVGACIWGASTAVGAGPPLPTAPAGGTVTAFASGLSTPTSFAFGPSGEVFAGDFGSEDGKTKGGVFLLKNGVATRIAKSPTPVSGVIWRGNALYVAAGTKLYRMTGWNGTSFSKIKTLYRGPKGFPGFNGIGFGANGRLYAGVGNASDHGPSSKPYAFDLLSFDKNGRHLKVVASGLRQPWQMVFPKGSSNPLVSDLGEDAGVKNPPDYVVRVKRGDDYGFPKCTWKKKSDCKGFAKPVQFFPAHSSAMGLGIIGDTLYVSLFGGIGKSGPEVVTVPVAGGASTPKPVLTGFVAPIVGLGVQGKSVYVGELTGTVYKLDTP